MDVSIWIISLDNIPQYNKIDCILEYRVIDKSYSSIIDKIIHPDKLSQIIQYMNHAFLRALLICMHVIYFPLLSTLIR